LGNVIALTARTGNTHTLRLYPVLNQQHELKFNSCRERAEARETEGFIAYQQDILLSTNPYSPDLGEDFYYWRDGWRRAFSLQASISSLEESKC
jgi:hypothetical protein